MSKRNQYVSMKVHKSFFDSIFEPERRRIQGKIGINLPQTTFTEMLAKSGAKFNYPKVDKKFMPSKFRIKL